MDSAGQKSNDQGDDRDIHSRREFGDHGEARHDGDTGEKHAILDRQQAKQLRYGFTSDHDGEGAKEHRRESKRQIDAGKRDLDRSKQRIGDDASEDDEAGGDQERRRNIENAFDLSGAVDFGADGAPQEPGDQQRFGAYGDQRHGKKVDGVKRDAEQDRRKRQEQRLEDEELKRRQHLAGRHHAQRREQKESAGQRIERGDDGKG